MWVYQSEHNDICSSLIDGHSICSGTSFAPVLFSGRKLILLHYDFSASIGFQMCFNPVYNDICIITLLYLDTGEQTQQNGGLISISKKMEKRVLQLDGYSRPQNKQKYCLLIYCELKHTVQT